MVFHIIRVRIYVDRRLGFVSAAGDGLGLFGTEFALGEALSRAPTSGERRGKLLTDVLVRLQSVIKLLVTWKVTTFPTLFLRFKIHFLHYGKFGKKRKP